MIVTEIKGDEYPIVMFVTSKNNPDLLKQKATDAYFWCREQFGDKGWYCGEYCFRFANEEYALMFALRWS